MAYFTRSRLLLLMLPSGGPVPPTPTPPPPPAGGDSTGYRRKRRVLRRIFKRSAQARADAEAFLVASAQTLTHAGVLKGTADEELAAFQEVLRDVLGYAERKTYTLVHLAVVDALLQALAAEVEREEELEEETVVLSLLGSMYGMRPTIH